MLLKYKNYSKNYKKKGILIGILVSFLSITHADVVTSIRPLSFIAAAITDGVTDVQILIPNNISPHDYSLKPSDLKKIKDADLFIWVGSYMETFLEKPLTQLPTQKRITLIEVPAVKALLLKNRNDSLLIKNKISYYRHDDLNHNHHVYSKYNMHIWLSPDIARIAANIIHNQLLALYPNHKKQLDINLRNFVNELMKTDKNIAKILQSIGNKQYFVFHDAYIYFEKHYHLTSLGYFTINPIIHPGAKRLYQIKKILDQKKAVCIFFESQFRPGVIKNKNVQMGILDPLGSNIRLSKNSYLEFLTVLSNQFKSCLDKNRRN